MYCYELLGKLYGIIENPYQWCFHEDNCCPRPILMLNLTTHIDCSNQCASSENEPIIDESGVDCCVMICMLTEVNFLQFSTDPNIFPQFNPEGFIKMFLTSVDFDPTWEPSIRSSTLRCYDDMGDLNEGYYCGVIPKYVKDMNLCTFKENYAKCPHWSLKGNHSTCEMCREFMWECHDDVIKQVDGKNSMIDIDPDTHDIPT